MNAVVETTFRGVSCRNCGKPVRLSAALFDRQESHSNPDLATKTFAIRCKRCNREGLYSVGEISDFPTQLISFGRQTAESHAVGIASVQADAGGHTGGSSF